MASAKTKSNKREKFTDWKNTQWVMNNLTEPELEQADTHEFDADRFAEFLELCIQNGLSIKADWDNYSECYTVSASGSWKGFPSTGYACSSRSPELIDAFKLLWFKVYEIANFDLSQFAEKRTRRKRG